MAEEIKREDSSNTASIKLTPHQQRVQDALADRHINVFNVVEIIAHEKVADIMVRMEMCTCSKCACDVLAIALNSLPTKYVTSDAGKQYIQLNSYKRQFETDVEIALMKACLTVKESPNHKEEDIK
ncbi:MAG: late competence development ComFB family protein [Eubacteriales bacterium]|nr:late competence development ComFB family protein [Eubacteriales bacterium]